MLEPRILYLLERWLFQLLMPVLDACVVSVDVQRSGYAVWVFGNLRNLELRKRTGMNRLNISNANLTGLMGDVDVCYV